MADTKVRIVDQSAHAVAHELMRDVMIAEGKTTPNVDRAYLLKLYYECQRVVVCGVDPAR